MADPNLQYDPITGWLDADIMLTNPPSQDATREQFQRLFTQIQTFENDTMVPYVKELDSANVKKTTDQTIDGIKTFTSSPIVPTPTTDMQASTKKYVDDNFTTKTEITTSRKLSATGDFTGTLNGMPIVQDQTGLTSTVAYHTTQLAENANEVNHFFVNKETIPAVDGTGEINALTVTSSAIYALYNTLVSANASYITKTTIQSDNAGTLSTDIYIFSPANYKKTIILSASIHGDEAGGDPKDNAIALYYFMKTLCNNWNNNSKLAELRYNYRIIVIPIQNKWGFDNNSRYNANGVDINRNFAFKWEESTDTRKGNYPFSEPETRIIRNVLHTYSDACAYIDFHNMGHTEDQLPQHFMFVSTSTSPMNGIGADITKYLGNKYNVPYLVSSSGHDLSPSSYPYSEAVLGIPSSNPEFLVHTTSIPERTSEQMKKMVDWYGNFVYQCCTTDLTKKVDGVKNKIINGALLNGSAGWYTYNNIAAINYAIDTGALKMKLANATTGLAQYIPSILNHQYYFSFDAKTDVGASFTTMQYGFATLGAGSQPETVNITSSFSKIAKIITANNNWKEIVFGRVATGDYYLHIKNVILLDLTEIFGVGNEPTLAEMNIIMAYFPNNFFDGTLELLEWQKVMMKYYKTKLGV